MPSLSPDSGNPGPPFKVLSVFGTRPEIIKFAPVLAELEQRPDLRPVNVSTSQHTDLAAPFLSEFQIRVDHDLQAMRPGQALSQLCSRILGDLDRILEAEAPDFVVVQGDTTSAMTGALAAFHRNIPVGHLEAGLRSGDIHSPYPEEMNRILISKLATAHFAATERNQATLLREGIAPESIFLTGNTVVDAVTRMLTSDQVSPRVQTLLQETEGTRRIVLTAHRRENFAGKMAEYFRVLHAFLTKNTDVSLIFPVHPNPNVRRITQEHFEGIDRVKLAEPMPYPDFVRLLSHAWLIVSDSGGVQEEAPTLRKPLLIIRENTERPESVECGAAKLIGESSEALARYLDEAHDGADWMQLAARAENPFGDGQAGRRVVDAISQILNSKTA